MSEFFIVGDRKFVADTASNLQLYRFKAASNPRSEAQRRQAGIPDIFPLLDGVQRVELDEGRQNYLADINPAILRRHVAAFLGTTKAFANGTGFPAKPWHPRRANYLEGTDLTYPNPEFDKVRTCSFAVHAGTDDGMFVTLRAFNGTDPFPSLNEINPLTHPYMYFHATTVDQNGDVGRFPNSAQAWGHRAVWMPLVATVPIRVPLAQVDKVPEWTPPPYS